MMNGIFADCMSEFAIKPMSGTARAFYVLLIFFSIAPSMSAQSPDSLYRFKFFDSWYSPLSPCDYPIRKQSGLIFTSITKSNGEPRSVWTVEASAGEPVFLQFIRDNYKGLTCPGGRTHDTMSLIINYSRCGVNYSDGSVIDSIIFVHGTFELTDRVSFNDWKLFAGAPGIPGVNHPSINRLAFRQGSFVPWCNVSSLRISYNFAGITTVLSYAYHTGESLLAPGSGFTYTWSPASTVCLSVRCNALKLKSGLFYAGNEPFTGVCGHNYSDGTSIQSRFTNGKRDGLRIKYDKPGAIIWRQSWENGKLLEEENANIP